MFTLQQIVRNPSLVFRMIPLPVALVIFFFAIVIHECAHAWMASRCGDNTARYAGRITLNPLPHIDPIGTIILPLLLILSRSSFVIGWAKPVPINPLNFNNPRADLVRVGAAGPLSNIGLAIGSSFLVWIFSYLPVGEIKNSIIIILLFSVLINLLLAVFNLLPIPPLDGSQILSGLLPDHLARRYETISRYGFIIIFLLLLTGLLWAIILPIVQFLYSLLFLWAGRGF
ncbi:MAG: site-2 protease family protein [Elusimicrobiota bacterium]|nr:site-2 protease family protein [Elusimicrobiota bacterium]